MQNMRLLSTVQQIIKFGVRYDPSGGYLSLVPYSFYGVSVQEDLCRETHWNQKSGQYTSYWNALLFTE